MSLTTLGGGGGSPTNYSQGGINGGGQYHFGPYVTPVTASDFGSSNNVSGISGYAYISNPGGYGGGGSSTGRLAQFVPGGSIGATQSTYYGGSGGGACLFGIGGNGGSGNDGSGGVLNGYAGSGYGSGGGGGGTSITTGGTGGNGAPGMVQLMWLEGL